MLVQFLKDEENETFLKGYENDNKRFFIQVGFEGELNHVTRFTTLDVEDAEFLIKELTNFVNNK